ncbi:MAG: cysteine peptidase family C39 domain-containing protein [Planctomycetota bacterium]
MPGSAIWFVLVAAMLPAAWFGGRACGQIQDKLRRSCVIGLAFVLLIGWSLLIKHPAIAVQVIPLAALARLEGIGAAPLFLFMIAVGWHLAVLKRQRAVMVVGMLLGAAYFVQGGLWMMRPTPSNAFTEQSNRLIVEQTQDYSCVPAASATVLRMLGLNATEAQMAELTETRAGTGATLLRALNGLQARLKHTGLEAKLLEPDYDTLMRIETPILTPVQYEAARLHMVTIVEVRPHVVLVADPQVGVEFLSRRQFEQIYRGQIIAFHGNAERATTEEVLQQNWHVIDPDLSRQAKYE